MIISSGLFGSGVDNHLTRWDGTSGLRSSAGILDDSGNLTGLNSINIGDITWGLTNTLSSSQDFTAVSDLDLNLISNNGNVNIIAIGTGGQANIASDGDCTFGSASGSFSLIAGTTASLTASAGDLSLIATSGNIFLGSGGSGQIIAAASGTVGTNDLLVNKFALMGSTISSTSIMNLSGSGAARTIFNLGFTYTGSASSAGAIICSTTDQGTGATFTLANLLSQSKLSSTSHTTNYTQYAYRAELGIDSSIVTTTGNYQLYAFRAMCAQQGVGNASTSGGTFYRVGYFQDSITAIAGSPTVDKFVGGHFRDALSLQKDNTLVFDSDIALGNNPSGTTFTIGTTTMSYISASSLLRTKVAGTTVWDLTTTANTSKVDLKLDQAGTGIYLKEGTNCHMGVATLVGGTVTVNTTKAVTGVRIFLSRFTNGGTIGSLSYTVTSGTSFTINSTSILDTSVVNWLIISQA